MKAGLLMALESSGARAEQLARQMIAYGRPIPLDEIVAKIEAVTVESARAAGRRCSRAAGPPSPRSGPAAGLRVPPRSRKVSCVEQARVAPARSKSHGVVSARRQPARRASCPPIAGRRRLPARAADGRLRRMGGAARGEPRFPDALGADLAGRRSDARVVPPPAQALCRGPAHRPGLCRSSSSARTTTPWSAA